MRERRQLAIQGICQGVGFRPFVYNLAHQIGLSGHICNTNEGVAIEVEGSTPQLDKFIEKLHRDKPANASFEKVACYQIPVVNENSFQIIKSDVHQHPNTIILPDLATCSECLNEIKDPGNRRYRYPFTNCTNCGPRFSLVEKLPYDREQTTMRHFPMCEACRKEYEDPSDRRFHAQPNACPECGPQLALWDRKGHPLAVSEEALQQACKRIREGKIVALKGVGGFQFLVDAANDESIHILRERKQRREKPFAVMYPDLELLKTHCEVSPMEEELLLSQAAPIVLLKAKQAPSSLIAPDNPYLGVMLPYSPLHHLILSELASPVLATSGNRAQEPICIDEEEAIRDLSEIADYFLVHNRPIAHAIDDSIVRVVQGEKMMLRRARGYASIPFKIQRELPPTLAVGGHLKNTVAVAKGNTIYLSQHLGDLETQKAYDHFTQEIDHLLKFYAIDPQVIVSDAHPDYISTQYADRMGKGASRVACQHHVSHVYSCMLEHQLSGPLLGVSWDGTGYGLDHTIWGGEFFLIKEDLSFERIAHMRPFPLPCGERAIKEPRLSYLGMLYAILGDRVFEREDLPFAPQELSNLSHLLRSRFCAPQCSSVGRIFDAVASLVGVRHQTSFEGQAAIQLEFLAERIRTKERYPFHFDNRVIDWGPMIHCLLHDRESGIAMESIAARFHNTLAQMIVEIAERSGQQTVALSGGVFQNKQLTERTIGLLRERQFETYIHQEIPPNDGGISAGQLYGTVVCA